MICFLTAKRDRCTANSASLESRMQVSEPLDPPASMKNGVWGEKEITRLTCVPSCRSVPRMQFQDKTNRDRCHLQLNRGAVRRVSPRAVVLPSTFITVWPAFWFHSAEAAVSPWPGIVKSLCSSLVGSVLSVIAVTTQSAEIRFLS
jgi:hypothetical protein